MDRGEILGKLVLASLITLDGFIDHTAMIADDELHRFSTRELQNTSAVLFGRVTYQLFESSWPPIMTDPSMPPEMVEYAHAIDAVPKIVFSKTLENVTWNNSSLRHEVDPGEIADLKARSSGDLVISSGAKLARHMIGLGLVDEYKLFLNPIILGSGLSLFDGLRRHLELTLLETSSFGSGVVYLHYRAGSLVS